MEQIEEKERILSEENYGIRADELKLSDIDRSLGSIRDRLADEREDSVTLKDAVLLSQVQIHSLGTAAKMAMENLKKVQGEVEELLRKEQTLHEILAVMRQKLEDFQKVRNNSDSQVSGMEKLIDEEEVKLDRLVKEMELMKKYFWERSNEKVLIGKEIVWFDTRISRFKHSLSAMDAREFSNMEYVRLKAYPFLS